MAGKGVAEVPESRTKPKASSFERELTTKTLTRAPLISISAIIGDIVSDSSMLDVEDQASDSHTSDTKEEVKEISKRRRDLESDKEDTAVAAAVEGGSTISARVEGEAEESLEEAQVVPVWEPDTRQDDQIAPATQPASQQKRDNNVNEVCPWEDE